MIYDEVHSFARDYINVKSFRTQARKAKIKKAYELLTGKKIKISCSTCYIEALLTIINNTKNMSAQNYELKRGVFLQPFGHPELAGGNAELTDEKAKKILEIQPELLVYFSRVPSTIRSVVPSSITIIPPTEKVIEPTVDKLAEKLISGVTGEKKERKSPIKSKAKK